MAYSQWARILIKSKSVELAIKNVDLKYGKFHFDGKKDTEIEIKNIEGQIIPKNNGGLLLCTCGREDSPSGTEGSFDIYTGDGSAKIGHYYWECPWASKTNTSTWTQLSEDYTGGANGGNLDSGALSDVTITIGRA